MLMQFRDAMGKSQTLKFVLVGVICVPFALFGIGSYFGNSGDVVVATVNGEEIPRTALEQTLYQQQQRFRQMFGGQLPEGLMDTAQMREGALEQLVQQSLMAQRVVEQRYTVSDAELARAIRERADFQTDGAFDQTLYERILAANRTSPAAFEQSLRQDQGLQQLFDAITRSAFSLPGERSRATDLQTQEREFGYLSIDTDVLAEAIEVSDEDIQAAYEAHPERYQRPEQYRVFYVELDPAALEADIDISDEDIESAYAARQDEYATEEQREASHILFELAADADESTANEVQAEADAVLERLRAGEDFAALAEEFSDDPGSASNGGSLGFFGRGAMVEPFENAVFALAEGELSEAVRSDFGIHLIKLTGIRESQVRPLDEVREALRRSLSEERIADAYLEQQELLANAAYENGGSLEPAAEAIGAEVVHSPWFSEEEQIDIGVHAAVRTALNEPDVRDNGLNSEVIEVADNHAVVIRLDETRAPELKPLEEVRERVLASVREERAQSEGEALAEALQAQLEGGASLEEAAAELDAVAATEAAWVGRQDPSVDRSLLAEIFTRAHPGEGAPVIETAKASTGKPVVFVLSGVRTPAPEEGTEAPPVQAATGTADFQALQQYMRDTADVSIDEAAMSAGGHGMAEEQG